MTQENQDLTRECITTIKFLAIDAIEKANSGHPGMPMGAADYTYLLWSKHLRFATSNPKWINRDRFVLSAGHGSMLLYSLLYLTGHEVTMDDLKNFRQWGSATPGHPECFRTSGVETTTGPLGQGVANAVGMALAGKMMAARFNSADFSPIDHHVYAVAGDGDLMEGIASEASSLAGHLELSNLILIYDDNHISIDGGTDITFTEDVQKRYESYGWFTQKIDGHHHEEILHALDAAKNERKRPSIILARTHIGKDAPTKQDKSSSHGSPLGKEEVAGVRAKLGWSAYEPFHVPEPVREKFLGIAKARNEEYENWCEKFEGWRKKNKEKANTWDAMFSEDENPDCWTEVFANLPPMPDATRSVSSKVQQIVGRHFPQLVGGSADLASSCKTILKDEPWIQPSNYGGRNIAFGIREHAMGGVVNGLRLYGGWIPYGSTFLVFSDYMRPSIRLAALSQLQSLFIFTHDSVFLGEDGPTHQPVEHLASLRLIPNTNVFRPATPKECAMSWKLAMETKEAPSVFSLSRQNLSMTEDMRDPDPEEMERGAYIAFGDACETPHAVCIATGSELNLAVEVAVALQKEGVHMRVVSMFCAEIFGRQSRKYREDILGDQAIPRMAIEVGRSNLWREWVGRDGLVLGVDAFGESAPDHVIASKLGFTPDSVKEKVSTWLKDLS